MAVFVLPLDLPQLEPFFALPVTVFDPGLDVSVVPVDGFRIHFIVGYFVEKQRV